MPTTMSSVGHSASTRKISSLNHIVQKSILNILLYVVLNNVVMSYEKRVGVARD